MLTQVLIETIAADPKAKHVRWRRQRPCRQMAISTHILEMNLGVQYRVVSFPIEETLGLTSKEGFLKKKQSVSTPYYPHHPLQIFRAETI